MEDAMVSVNESKITTATITGEISLPFSLVSLPRLLQQLHKHGCISEGFGGIGMTQTCLLVAATATGSPLQYQTLRIRGG